MITMMPQMQARPDTMLCSTDNTNYYTCTPDAACLDGMYYKYPSNVVKTWITQFDLVCDSTVFLKLIYYFFLGGFLIGALVLAPLADHYGRKGLIVLSAVLICPVYLKAVFTSDPITCAVVLCCCGVLVGVFYCVSITYLTELATQESAMVYTTMFHMAFPVSGTLVALLLRGFRSWTVVTAVFAFVPLVILLYMTAVAESPRFLASKGLYKDARIAANSVCACNTGKKKRWNFAYEHATYMQEYNKFSEEREGKILQHAYFASYASSRYYLLAFFVLLFTSGFAFSGLALTERKLFSKPFMNTLMLQAIEATLLFLTGFFVQIFGHKRTIGYSLLATGILGILCTLMLAVDTYIGGVVVYITKLTATVSFVSSIAFSAELCPARVRATGFGMCIGAATAGLMCGGFVLEFYSNLHILFGVVAACGVLVMPWVKEPAMYSTNDDIYEINEFRKNNYKDDAKKYLPLGLSPIAERKSESPMDRKDGLNLVPNEPFGPAENECILYNVEGSRLVKERQEPIGFDLFQLSMDGTIKHEGKDEIGEYVLTGKIFHGSQITLLKRYKDGTEIRFEGSRTRENVSGTWSDENDKGDFTFALRLRPWKGVVGASGAQAAAEWFLEQTGRKIHGLAEQDGLALFISGSVQENGTVNLLAMSEDGKKRRLEGRMDYNAIHGPEISLKLSKDS